MSIRVLLADDQAMVRAGFRMLLEAQPDIEVKSVVCGQYLLIKPVPRYCEELDLRVPWSHIALS